MDNGAHYHRSDLQVHTPRDPAWSGPRPTDDGRRGEYAVSFIEACRKKDLDAVAITDHHDLTFVEFIREAAAVETDSNGAPLAGHERLAVFPGLELTLSVPCQALLLFDADLPIEKLHSVLSILGIEDIDESASKHDQPTPLDFPSLEELHDRLDSRKWLRGRYAVFPNVTDTGHKTLIRSGMQANYRGIRCVGGYVDKDAAKMGNGARTILAGEDPAWGDTKLAVIQTSDSRSSKFGKLGQHSTWIKWATPSAEALRQACLADESRISLSEPELPAVVITELRVSNSKFMGPVELAVNPQYNALIGGRGTGKSTCLEYLRWALCDQPPDFAGDDELLDHARRRSRLIPQTLEPFDAKVEVAFEVNGIPHLLRRSATTGEVSLKVGTKDARPASPQEIRDLLPIEAYSQRQLSSVSVQVDELTRFIEAPIREELGSVRAQIEGKAEEVRANFSSLQRERSLNREVARDSLNLESLSQQIESLREGLSGLSEADQRCLAERSNYDEADHLVENWMEQLASAGEAVEDLGTRLNRLQANLAETGEDLPNANLINELRSSVRAAIEHAQDGADAAAAALEAGGRKASKRRTTWKKKLTAYLKRYSTATKRSSVHASRLEELEALERRQRELKLAISGNRDQLATLGDPAERDIQLRGEWHRLHSERSGLIEAQCERLTGLSDGLIKASLLRHAANARVAEALKSAFRGTSIRATKVERFVEEVSASEDPLRIWQEAIAELDMLLVSESESASTPPLRSKLGFFGGEEIAKVVSRISPEQVLELSLLALGDEPAFQYRTKEGEYIEFADASAGQQATALLRVLLNQDGPPLIIDQPEDDLDSQVILEVVEKIWEAKRRRQLIFASHNANLVVNGDAELVVCFDYRKEGDHSSGRIKREGAIDIPTVKDEITVVMEGGEKAFRLRKDKYGF